ncbi:hypothetical protein B0J14DRAFT_707061 [Halenospora varia]|nr:hypothetical protein B0J14DRAFT_707061 [Halenospora varia]
MQFSTTASILAIMAIGAIARNCTPGLNYCGATLLDVGKYQPQIDQAIHDAGQLEENFGKEDLFHCASPGGPSGVINWLHHCGAGCSNNGRGNHDTCL